MGPVSLHKTTGMDILGMDTPPLKDTAGSITLGSSTEGRVDLDAEKGTFDYP